MNGRVRLVRRGPAGPRSEFFHGEGVPGVVSGSHIGDAYLDRLTGKLYKRGALPTSWVEIADLTGPPGPGTGAGAWAPDTAYTVNQVVQAPDGSLIHRDSSGTSRATFDATERAAWTGIEAIPGTISNEAGAKAYASNPAPEWAGNRKGFFDPALGLYRPTPTGLQRARAKAARAATKTGSLHILTYGDSQTQGLDVVNPWPYQLRDMLAERVGLGGTGIRFPEIGWGGNWTWNEGPEGFESLIPYGVYPHQFFGSTVVSIDPDSSIDITAGIDYDYVVLYYMSSGASGPTIRRNGVTGDPDNQWLVPGFPGATPSAPLWTSLESEDGYMQGEIAGIFGGQVVCILTPTDPQPTDVYRLMGCYDGETKAIFAGIEFRKNDSEGGVRVSNMAVNGRTLKEAVVGYPAGSADDTKGQSGLAVGLDMTRPDLVFCALSGTNDWNDDDADPANFKTWLTTFVNRARTTDLQGTLLNSSAANADVILVVMPEMDYDFYAGSLGNDNSPPYRDFMRAVYEVADELDVPVIDLAWRWPDHARASTLGIKKDHVHPSDIVGMRDYAQAINAALTVLLGI